MKLVREILYGAFNGLVIIGLFSLFVLISLSVVD